MPYISLTIFVKLFQKPNSLAKLLSLLSVFFLFFFVTHGQEASTPYFHNAENEISLLAGQMSDVKFNDSLLFQRNDSLQQLVFNTLKAENSFSYLFDSLKHIGCIKSEDGLLRIFTWNLVKADGTHHHYGFMQYYLKAQKEVLLIPLTDKSDSIAEPEIEVLTPENWFGATYYQVLTNGHSSGTVYTLIGWDGNNLYTNKKVIDVLQFSENGKAKFGKAVFKAGKKKLRRIIFEYSRMAAMMIKYDPQYQMIVMDHLAPSESVYTGNFRFYGPDLSYDGLKFNEDMWEYIPTIDYKKPKPKRGLFK
ncbi:MAG TPA: hypothetical protein DCQ26_15825 [Marinilabiliales bacterium]|nr:MAG: hypothetical protein A2W95_04980 [Bacteroidetes bacterium GWA2_40_14]OFX60456.1 MAG: hypothetical protein A2W84_05060 [Bacteroidetes bacterium GWC2_40_13]OFX75487.1 MAG: hypothetical protein A2W96_08510 [Bacteroidetes bacterium GWD2_40_43]OFX94002.1 MAG: hypothetical protein A2W97_14435 [Bacteroidetes bacterium GWE2_40_63]OFY19789.1 MAG: hypothetical protein A2W88_03305 [Bacteroidetes bacterium GWF2_40_13]OFZ28201.1 MAG: hypothetical protein A2437_04800 [Bacteroidetes bacterium RIFOXYC